MMDRREWERVEYDDGLRPKLQIGRQLHDVVDCSERGVRYRVEEAPPPQVGSEVVGRVRFSDGWSVDVEGAVVRLEADPAPAVAVHFTARWIPREAILSEKRRLRMQERGRGRGRDD